MARAAPPGRRGGERLKRARRTPSSTHWLKRQLSDPYVAAARRAGYRSRSAFKLIELDDRFHILRIGQTVVDLGAAPGGWSQVAAERTGAAAGKGRVVAVDRAAMVPLAGVTILERDTDAPETVDAVRLAAGGAVDVVLSDLAPATTGHRATDHLRVVALSERAAALAVAVLRPGGAFVTKVFQGGATPALLAELRRLFRSVRHAKPPASRRESAETYLVAQGFRGAPAAAAATNRVAGVA
ncbi:MAG: RlmE family RNA methyltransferase [Alphaproteobacteria bacterium]|nr:RlmE family RNA methyltransferase [Alphaproteobacteria bacterium]